MQHIKKIYLYLVSAISLVIMVVGGIMLLNMALKATVFKNADRYAYYPVAMCSQVPPVDGKPMPECEPGYEEKQRAAEEQNRTSQRQRDASQALSMIIIAAPVWFFHWRMARKES